MSLGAEIFLFLSFWRIYYNLYYYFLKGNEKMKRSNTTYYFIVTAMLSALAGILMSMEFPLPLMPPFYKVDFSDVPSVIATFLLGPVSGICVEVIKILIKLITVGTTTMFVGEFANLLGTFLFVLPIWFLFKKFGKTRKAAMISLGVNLPIRIAFSCVLNACITLPLYAKAMGISLDDVVRTVGAVNPLIKNLPLFLVLATIPFNLIKLLVNYIIGYFLYERLKAVKVVRRLEEQV